MRQTVKPWQKALKENIVMQEYDYSCGSAALATLLRYYFQDPLGEKEAIEAIFKRIGKAENPVAELQDRYDNGFSMLDLLNAAKDLGYLGAVVRIPFDKLKDSKAPVIVRIEKEDFKHFVVVRGVVDDRVYLADPLRGNIRVPEREFRKQWSGEALFLGKIGFGLPTDHPLAIKSRGPAQPELDHARLSLFRRTRPGM